MISATTTISTLITTTATMTTLCTSFIGGTSLFYSGNNPISTIATTTALIRYNQMDSSGNVHPPISIRTHNNNPYSGNLHGNINSGFNTAYQYQQQRSSIANNWWLGGLHGNSNIPNEASKTFANTVSNIQSVPFHKRHHLPSRVMMVDNNDINRGKNGSSISKQAITNSNTLSETSKASTGYMSNMVCCPPFTAFHKQLNNQDHYNNNYHHHSSHNQHNNNSNSNNNSNINSKNYCRYNYHQNSNTCVARNSSNAASTFYQISTCSSDNSTPKPRFVLSS